MSARDEVLARIRSAVGPSPHIPDVVRDYRSSGEHPAGSEELLDLLTDRLVDYRATVRRSSRADVAATLAEILPSGDDGSAPIVVPPGLPPEWTEGLDALRDDQLTTEVLDTARGVVTGCAVAIAETGTIVLDAGPDQGRRVITLVPDLYVCVVRADQVVQTVPEGLRRLDPTRPLTMVSGPSATSDIELNRVEGVHGPRTLHVVLVTD